MRKLLKNEVFKSLLSTLIFGVIYVLVSFAVDGTVEIGKVLIVMACYFPILCLFNIAARKLGGSEDHDNNG